MTTEEAAPHIPNLGRHCPLCIELIKQGVVLPATIMLTQIGGITGKLVWLMQAINGDLSKWTHVAVVLDDDTVFEAQPGGAVISPRAKYNGADVAYVPWHMPDDVREAIVRDALKLEGTGYNWTTYFYMAVYRLNLPVLTKLLRKRVERSDLFICSQVADSLYRKRDQKLFDDHRLPFDITPGDFRELLP